MNQIGVSHTVLQRSVLAAVDIEAVLFCHLLHTGVENFAVKEFACVVNGHVATYLNFLTVAFLIHDDVESIFVGSGFDVVLFYIVGKILSLSLLCLTQVLEIDLAFLTHLFLTDDVGEVYLIIESHAGVLLVESGELHAVFVQ